MELIVIAAMARNRVIGKNGTIPWHVPEDLRQFKQVTMGHPVVMGRRTFETIGRPLPGRRNVVISRDPSYTAPGCEVTGSLQAAVDRLQGEAKVFIAGGGEIYRQSLALADRVRLTVIDLEVAGDTFFPELPEDRFILAEQQKFSGSPAFTVYLFRRLAAKTDSTAEEAFAVRVECYSGYRGEETPRRFRLGERRVEVLEIVDRWLAPDHRYFKVRGNDRAFYILRHDVQSGRWELQLYQGKM